MNKSFNPIPHDGNDKDLSKRLVRNIADIVRSLDDARGRAKGIIDLLSPVVQVQRAKLHDLCYRLILLDPVSQGKRGEDILWRKGYHDVLTTARTFKHGDAWLEDDASLVIGLLSSGVGYYHHFLLKLQAEYGLDALHSIDFPLCVDDHGLPKAKGGNGKQDETAWVQPLAARVLICLGDLSRYLIEVEPGWDVGSAARFYLQAACLAPSQGRPYNQLGTLAGSRNFSLDAVYYYLHSLNCSEPFTGALANLYKVLERNVTTFDIKGPAHKVIHRLLLAIDSWYCDKEVQNFSVVCSELVESFHLCMESPQGTEILHEYDWDRPFAHVDSPGRLSTSCIIKVMAILMICFDKMKTADSPRLTEVQSILILLSGHIVHPVATRWKKSCGTKRRRRRRLSAGSARSESSGSVSGSASSAGESASSDDETAHSTQDKRVLSNGIAPVKKEITADEDLLQPLHVVFSWIKTLPELWSVWPEPVKPSQKNILVILNYLTELCVGVEFNDSSRMPLPEDLALSGISIFETAQNNIDWTLRPRATDETKARYKRIVDIGRQLPGLVFDDQLQRFVLEKPASSEQKGKGDLMKHMGQLWLQWEVEALESRTSGPGGASPYLVIDAFALVDHIISVKQMLGSRQFILVIPAVVLSTVDEWKHESGRSREAIRWLETQFLRGNRALRSQKAHEKLPFSLMKYPKKKDKDAWKAFQMLECCHYLRKQSSLLVTLLTGSRSPALNSEAAALASSFGINVEGIDSFYAKWKDSKTLGKEVKQKNI